MRRVGLQPHDRLQAQDPHQQLPAQQHLQNLGGLEAVSPCRSCPASHTNAWVPKDSINCRVSLSVTMNSVWFSIGRSARCRCGWPGRQHVLEPPVPEHNEEGLWQGVRLTAMPCETRTVRLDSRLGPTFAGSTLPRQPARPLPRLQSYPAAGGGARAGSHMSIPMIVNTNSSKAETTSISRHIISRNTCVIHRSASPLKWPPTLPHGSFKPEPIVRRARRKSPALLGAQPRLQPGPRPAFRYFSGRAPSHRRR